MYNIIVDAGVIVHFSKPSFLHVSCEHRAV